MLPEAGQAHFVTRQYFVSVFALYGPSQKWSMFERALGKEGLACNNIRFCLHRRCCPYGFDELRTGKAFVLPHVLPHSSASFHKIPGNRITLFADLKVHALKLYNRPFTESDAGFHIPSYPDGSCANQTSSL